MRPLVIGAAQTAQIATLRACAAENVMDPEAMKTAAAKDIAAYQSMMMELSIELPFGYLVTYSHERQPQHGVVAHISITVDRPNRMPHPAAVNMILAAFGLRSIEDSIGVWIEDVSPGEKAINVLQRMVS